MRTPYTFALILATSLAAAVHPARAAEQLSDSTVVSRWSLGNGLRVSTRHVPGANAVAITLGYGVGADHDPKDRQGLAQLSGLIGFTAPAGGAPARTREDLDSTRPLGWSYPVQRRATLFTEVASIEQFAGVLSQVAERMRGVQVTPEALNAAVKEIKRETAEQYFGSSDVALHHQLRDVSQGRSDEEIVRRAAAKDLDRVTLKELQAHLARVFVPANATLSLAGNLDGVDVRKLVDQLFGAIPAGKKIVDPPPTRYTAGTRSVIRTGDAAGMLGVVGPPVSDSLHPSFYTTLQILAGESEQLWNDPKKPRVARMQYSLLDEPDLVRFLVPVDRAETDPNALGVRFNEVVMRLQMGAFRPEHLEYIHDQLSWPLGGPMPEEKAAEARTRPELLHTLARSQAACELRGGSAFWDRYRENMRRHLVDPQRWARFMETSSRQIRLLFRPRSATP